MPGIPVHTLISIRTTVLYVVYSVHILLDVKVQSLLQYMFGYTRASKRCFTVHKKDGHL